MCASPHRVSCLPIVALWWLVSVAAPVQASTSLARQQGCLGCHAAASRLVGPSLQEVAAKYGRDKAAVAVLAASIRAGGRGKWGDVAMPPQAQLKEAQARRLAEWILSGAK